MNNFISSVKRKGLIETVFHGLCIVINKIISLLKVLVLRFRGYNIDYSVVFKGSSTVFQSTFKAINISRNTTLGKNTRITAGEKGKIYIGENVLLDDFSFVMAQEKIEIGKNTAIAPFCFIIDFNHKFDNHKISVLNQESETKPILIGDNVWIGTHSIILPGVKIGKGAVIGAGSIVTHDIPENSIAVGSPAKVIKKVS